MVVLTQFGQGPEGDKVATPGHCKQQQCTNLKMHDWIYASEDKLTGRGNFYFTFIVVSGSPEKRDLRFRST
jgi:hypothetical protein